VTPAAAAGTLVAAMLKLAPGQYLCPPLGGRRIGGLDVTLIAYPPGRSYPWHVHEQPTFFVLLAARHRDQTRLGSFDQPPLSAVFHPAAAPHATTTGPDGLVGINLELTDAWLDHWHLGRRDLDGDCRLLDAPWTRLLGLRLAVSANEAGDTADADVETAALELVGGLVRESGPVDRVPHWLPRAREFLAAAAQTPVRLRDVAAEVGIHPVYCARAFRRATGCTVSAYVHTLRLLDAGRQILHEGRPLADAALRAGFADQAHFTRTCSRALGFTPGRLRRVRQALATKPLQPRSGDRV
jgi:AraC family transcriptional regulator